MSEQAHIMPEAKKTMVFPLVLLLVLTFASNSGAQHASVDGDFFDSHLDAPLSDFDLGPVLIEIQQRANQDLLNRTIDKKKLQRRLDQLVERVKKRTGSWQDPEVVLSGIKEVLFQDLKLGTDRSRLFESSLETMLLDQVLESRQGHCLSLSLIFCYIAERLNVPVAVRHIPGHVFVRATQGKHGINIETTAQGRTFSDEHYLGMIPGPPGRERVIRSLNKRQAVWLYLAGLANHYKLTGRYDQAIAIFQAALAHFPDDASMRTNLGNVFERSGRLAQAQRQYRLAISLDPYLCEAHYNLGLLYFLYTPDRAAARRYGQRAQKMGCRMHPHFERFLEAIP